MAEVIKTYDPSLKTSDTFQATLPGSGNQGGKISLWNESNVGQFIQWKDSGRDHKDYLPPWTAILINICATNNLTFTWTQAFILNANNPPASTVIVVQYMPYENVSNAFPIPLPRQVTQGNFIGAQGVYAVYENTFTTAAGTHSETLPLPPTGQSMYVKRLEFSSGTVGAAAARCDIQLQNTDVNIITGFPSWEVQVAANAGIPITNIDFPGPVKGTTSQAMIFFINAPTNTFIALNVYYFFAV